jgi:hypothetical protein
MVVASTPSIGKHSDASPSFDDVIRFRCPPILPPAVKTAAARQMVSMSAYCRAAIIERLKRDGVDFANMGAA